MIRGEGKDELLAENASLRAETVALRRDLEKAHAEAEGRAGSLEWMMNRADLRARRRIADIETENTQLRARIAALTVPASQRQRAVQADQPRGGQSSRRVAEPHGSSPQTPLGPKRGDLAGNGGGQSHGGGGVKILKSALKNPLSSQPWTRADSPGASDYGYYSTDDDDENDSSLIVTVDRSGVGPQRQVSFSHTEPAAAHRAAASPRSRGAPAEDAPINLELRRVRLA